MVILLVLLHQLRIISWGKREEQGFIHQSKKKNNNNQYFFLFCIFLDMSDITHLRANGRPLTLRYKPPEDRLKSHVNLESRYENEKQKLPDRIDLSHHTGPIRDQKKMGCCVSFSLCTVARYLANKDKLFSPLFLYYVTRMQDGESPKQDIGSTIEEAIEAIENYGLAQEKYWPFHPKNLSLSPSRKAWKDGQKHRFIKAAPIAPNLHSIQMCLAGGYPVLFGLQLYESSEKKKALRSGVIRIPKSYERRLGGHCVVCVGYSGLDKDRGYFIIQNSWGTKVGNRGLFYIPYRYALNSNLCSEIYCVTEFDTL
jgi:C1A family cysteine protease